MEIASLDRAVCSDRVLGIHGFLRDQCDMRYGCYLSRRYTDCDSSPQHYTQMPSFIVPHCDFANVSSIFSSLTHYICAVRIVAGLHTHCEKILCTFFVTQETVFRRLYKIHDLIALRRKIRAEKPAWI